MSQFTNGWRNGFAKVKLVKWTLEQCSNMAGHYHLATAGTQNQGNILGDRPSVRISKKFLQDSSGAHIGSSLLTRYWLTIAHY